MANKQVFAQIGVFLLLGLNVAAYWFLWPNYHSVSSNEGKPAVQDKGATRLVPEPKVIPPSSLKDAVPLNIPASAAQSEKITPDQETLSKLFDHIQNEKTPTLPPLVTSPLDPTPAFPPIEMKKTVIEEKPTTLPNAPSPKPLPELQGDPLHSDVGPANPPVAVTSALTPKMSPSPWLLSMEMVGNRTQLLAKVRQPATSTIVAEFKILCDRVEMKSPGGELQALGKVTVVGTGLNGACKRLIVPIHETRLVFEEQVRIVHDHGSGSVLRGERIIWELPAPAAAPSLGLPK